MQVGRQQVALRLPILARCKDQQILIRLDEGARKLPLVEIFERIGQSPARQVDPLGPRIVDFNPVGRLVIGVLQDRAIRRHQFGDRQVAGEQFAAFERLDSQRTTPITLGSDPPAVATPVIETVIEAVQHVCSFRLLGEGCNLSDFKECSRNIRSRNIA